ncbi:hypothetical protein [Paraburkholderia sp. 22B1P]|uniref:hypothetical protein n=1 Tax=Paraburkholderia sp. 22B1P TaxID=3080498 RepID=UPI0030931E9B|nr:hypothetical protein PBP221_17310 [Paraburkholderia sp. 22B1P]
MKPIRITGAAARAFAAMVPANADADLTDGTSAAGYPFMTEQSVDHPDALTCLSCGAKKHPGKSLPCGH